jgi:hypothetical protein
MPDPSGRVMHLDDMHRGMSWKTYCRVATTANITIATALNNGDTLDGVTLATGAYPSAWAITTGSRKYSIRASILS